MDIEELVGPIVTAGFLLGMVAEALFARELFPSVRRWRLTGIAFFVINAAINIGLPLVLPVEWTQQHSLLPGYTLGVAGGFALGFIVFGFVYYWFHRLEHRWNWAWRTLHQLHHSALRVDISGFSYTNPLELALQTILALGVNVWLLGLHPQAAALVGLYSAIAALVQHLNVRTPGALEWIMQRPEAHVRHHEYAVHAFNYADWPVWDKLFGTYRAPTSVTPRVGFDQRAAQRVGAMLLGVDVNVEQSARARH
jgi:sterol desaturase/sphingolipid hydroxylase (fatty acid hydroxylase superfamily)